MKSKKKNTKSKANASRATATQPVPIVQEVANPQELLPRARIARFLHKQVIRVLVGNLCFVLFWNIALKYILFFVSYNKKELVEELGLLPTVLVLLHWTAVLSVLLYSRRRYKSLDNQFPPIEEDKLERHFRRTISPDDSFVHDCTWLYVGPRSEDIDTDTSAFIDAISKQALKMENSGSQYLFFFWPSLILLVSFILDMRFCRAALCVDDLIITVNGARETLFGSGSFQRTIYSVFAMSVIKTCQIAKVMGRWLGAKKLAVIINRDIQCMTQKFGYEAGVEMARTWDRRDPEPNGWVIGIKLIEMALCWTASRISDMIKCAIDWFVHWWFPTEEDGLEIIGPFAI